MRLPRQRAFVDGDCLWLDTLYRADSRVDTDSCRFQFFMRFLGRFRVYLGRVEKVIGLLLVIAGILFLSGQMQNFSFLLLETFPALGRLG